MNLTGLHHVTAITARARENLAFYTGLLGMRLVKKTVNQDDVSAYHLFYADALGSPGTDLTFFDWAHIAPAQSGAGSISEITLRTASRQSLEWWLERLDSAGVPNSGLCEEGGRALLRFNDPEGQRLALASTEGWPPAGVPWQESPVPQENAASGLDSIRLALRDPELTARLLMDMLGFRQAETASGPDLVFETGPGGPGTRVILEAVPLAPYARSGYGGVHHAAFRTPDAAQQAAWREILLTAGVRVTPVIDRFYFKSIYFREPGGVLFEIATDGPGFTSDEPAERLGERLSLPPFLEASRAQIEAGLEPL